MLAAERGLGGMKRAMAAGMAKLATTLSRAALGAAASFAFLLAPLAGTCVRDASAQQAGGWATDLDLKVKPPQPGEARQPARSQSNSGFGTTVLKKKSAEPQIPAGMSKVRLVALLTADGQRIEQDLVWRVYEQGSDTQPVGRMLSTQSETSPVLALRPGSYLVSVSFGRANLTRKITVAEGVEATEPFVLNAGGLRIRLNPAAGGMEGSKASFDILTDERDQSGNRRVVLSHARPGTVIRLNSGIYHIVSTLGDANATVGADVTVEAGKLTEASISHKAGRVTLKLVTRQGGEALPDTEWTVMTTDGQKVKSSVGALPTHILAPGRYLAVAKSQGRVFRQSFDLTDGQSIEVEVMRQ
jgi:hypothetical protein